MRRRDFLLLSAAGLVWKPAFARADLPDDLKVTRVIGFDLPSRRAKFVGKNSHLEGHGDKGGDRLLRIVTNSGLEGVGNCGSSETDAARLLRKNPFEFFDRNNRKMVSPLGRGTMPLWDLAGKALEKPVYELLGGEGPELVPVYDGSIYFQDLLPQHSDQWQQRFREEIDMGLARGHKAFKLKIGRGFKWMPRADGDARDLDVVKLFREHGGPDITIFVDANNGYSLAGAKRFLSQAADWKITFTEEMFPESVDECLEYKEFIRDNGWNTLLADGETQKELAAYKPFIEAKAIDVLQGDMNRFGFEGILTEANWAAPQGMTVAPHNWSSYVGYFMQLHVARAIPNFYRAEQDPLHNDVLIADGYTIENGQARVPDSPGCGLIVHEDKFASDVTIRFDIRA